MRNVNFCRMTENVKIETGVKYRINSNDDPACSIYVGIKNLKTALFYSTSCSAKSYKSSRNWLFIKVPPGAKFYSFSSISSIIQVPSEVVWREIEWHYDSPGFLRKERMSYEV